MQEDLTDDTIHEELIKKAESGATSLSPVLRLISQQITEVRATYRLTKILVGIAIATLAVGIASAVGVAFIVIPLLTRN